MERKEEIENSEVTGRKERNRKAEDDERSAHEADGSELNSDREDQGLPWQKIERKQQKQKRKMPIIIVGDSMMKDIRRNISMKEKSSELCSYPGAQIGTITEKVKEKCRDGGDDLVIIQGGGNNLTGIGHRETVEKILSTVKEITTGKKNRKVAVMGIFKRPRECINDRYDEERKKTNSILQTELCKMKVEKTQVSYIDMDAIIQDNMFSVDGVHLNREGNDRMSARILNWMKQKDIRIMERK